MMIFTSQSLKMIIFIKMKKKTIHKNKINYYYIIQLGYKSVSMQNMM